MFQLEDKHFAFLEICASNEAKTHLPVEGIEPEALQEMVKGLLLIEYKGQGIYNRYAITATGKAYLRSKTPPMSVQEKLQAAINHLMKNGHSAAASRQMVDREGVDRILSSKDLGNK